MCKFGYIEYLSSHQSLSAWAPLTTIVIRVAYSPIRIFINSNKHFGGYRVEIYAYEIGIGGVTFIVYTNISNLS